MPALTEDQRKLRDAAQAATPGPWHHDSDPIKGDPLNRLRCRVVAMGRTIMQSYYSSGGEDAQGESDNRFASLANPAAILALLAQVEAAPSVPAQTGIDLLAVADAARKRIAEEYERRVESRSCEMGGIVNRQWAHLEGAVKVVQAIRKALASTAVGQAHSKFGSPELQAMIVEQATSNPSGLARQVARAQAECETWSPEKRAGVRLEGSS